MKKLYIDVMTMGGRSINDRHQMIMKELSIEEKAKRFDEALAMAKECITYTPDDAVNKYMLNMFPELKESEESEDERTRKDIVFYIAANHKDDGEKARFLYWLEKQGEQKSNESHPIFRVGDYIINKKTSDQVLIEQLDVKSKAYCYKSYNGAAEIHSDFPFSKQDEWVLIGQKIIKQNPSWSEKDKCMLNNVIDTLKPLSQTTHSGYSINSMIGWLKSLRPQNRWKPSEHETNIFEDLIDGKVNPCNYHATLHAMLEQLKKLREE